MHGVVAVELNTGRIQAITARSVVLATGGCGKVFPFTTNAAINTGDGMALAYRAGAPLKDMEFVQYHPTGLPFTGILITEATRAEGGWLLNKDGYRYLQDYDLGTPTPEPTLRSMELGPRDRLSQAFVHEAEKGRTLDSEWGPIVHLDLRHLGAKLIDTKLPFVRELCLKYERIDPVTELIPVRPVVHYMMGGVHTDIDGATPARRPLRRRRDRVREHQRRQPPRLQLPARVPGVRCPRRPRRRRRTPRAPVLPLPPSPPRRLTRYGASSGSSAPRPATTPSPRSGPRCRRRWRTLPGSTGPGPEMAAGVDRLKELQERALRVGIWDTSRTFNTELVAALELANLLDVAECMLASGLRREESRGAHQRTDFPARDDERFLTHQMVERDPDGSPQVSDLPVTITRWPPGERTYGR